MLANDIKGVKLLRDSIISIVASDVPKRLKFTHAHFHLHNAHLIKFLQFLYDSSSVWNFPHSTSILLWWWSEYEISLANLVGSVITHSVPSVDLSLPPLLLSLVPDPTPPVTDRLPPPHPRSASARGPSSSPPNLLFHCVLLPRGQTYFVSVILCYCSETCFLSPWMNSCILLYHLRNKQINFLWKCELTCNMRQWLFRSYLMFSGSLGTTAAPYIATTGTSALELLHCPPPLPVIPQPRWCHLLNTSPFNPLILISTITHTRQSSLR